MANTHYEGEEVLITFEEEGRDQVYNYEGRITSLNISGGEKDRETVRPFGGYSIQFAKPAKEIEVTFDYIFRDGNFEYMKTGAFEGGNTTGKIIAGAEIRSGNEINEKRWRVIIWFLGEDAGIARNGTVQVPLRVGEIARFIFTDARALTNDVTFDSEDRANGTITFKLPPTDDTIYANKFFEWTSSQSGTALTVLNATAHKGILTWNTTTPAWTGGYRS